MFRAIVLSTMMVLSMIAPTLADHGNFHCDRLPFLHERAVKALKQLSHNRTMEVIVKEYAQQWEVQEIRRTCDAAAAGKPADFSCFQGRRDWDAIQSMIPEHLYGQDMVSLRPHQLKLQKMKAEEQPYEMAYRYCEGLGVLKR